MNTRSVASRNESSLSLTRYGAGMPCPSGVSTTFSGPMPMCVNSDAEPGPPL